MRLSLTTFHKLRIITATIVLFLALIYLSGQEAFSLAGFALLAVVATYICYHLRNGSMAAECDLCRSQATMKAEYGAGFSDARLVINCPQCGRVINGAKQGVEPQREK